MATKLLTAGRLLQRRWVGEPPALCPPAANPARPLHQHPPTLRPLCSLQGSGLRAAARAFAVGAAR